MRPRDYACSLALVLALSRSAPGQVVPPPPGNNQPLLRLEGGGPTSHVMALAFSPEGKSLYAAGFDKVVRTWEWNAKSGKFELDPQRNFRVPIHPGLDGAINALAVSSDGEWLAVGGLGTLRGGADFAQTGRLWPSSALTLADRADRGVIYVFSTRGQVVKRLYGHRRPIVALAFAPSRDKKPPILVSAAQELDFQTGQKRGEARVWNVAEEEALGETPEFPPTLNAGNPRLAAVPTGEQPKQVRVFIAWGDARKLPQGQLGGSLRTWNVVDPPSSQARADDGYQNTVLALAPGGKRILTGSFAARKGQLKVWETAADPMVPSQQIALDAPDGVFPFPDDLALCAAHGAETQAATPLAAVLVRLVDRQGKELGYELRLLDIAPGAFGQQRRQVALGMMAGQAPIIAAAPQGRFVAIAGAADHSIRLYALSDLLNPKIKDADVQPRQTLQSVGVTMRHVAFVESIDQGKTRRGLALSESARPNGPGLKVSDVVFDFERRGFTQPGADWQTAAPPRHAWRLAPVFGNGALTALQLFEDEKKGMQIALADGTHVTSHAWAPVASPWLAVATYRVSTGSANLDLYLARTGQHIRRFEGHTAPISSLAVSRDGKLLASTSNDQTIAIWSVGDLDEIVGRHGGMPGVRVVHREQAKDVVTVEGVDESSPAQGKLAPGTVIEGLYDATGAVKAMRIPRDFFDAFWNAPPGADLRFRIRAGERVTDVSLTVAQGVDVRKPLFTLFVTAPQAGGQRAWLGWNALGPFDSSGPAAEDQVGWHFNTGRAEEPTQFAGLAQYRAKYYKPDLLRHLVATASLAAGLEAHKKAQAPRPQPKINTPVGVEQAPNGDFLVRQRKNVLQFALRDYTFAEQDVITWKLNNDPPRRLEASIGNLWTIDLPELPAERKRHRIEVVVRLQEHGRPATVVSQAWNLRYQPPAPRLRFAPKASRLASDQDLPYDLATASEYDFRAMLETPGMGPRCHVSLWLNDQPVPPKSQIYARSDQPQAIARMLSLKEGDNLVKVVAQNEAAMTAFEDDERQTMTVRVFYKPNAPTVSVRSIEPIDEDEDGPTRFVPEQPIVVRVPRVRVRGTIQADVALDAAGWDRGQETPRAVLSDFKAGAKTMTFVQEVELRPGPQKIRVVAKTAQSREGVETISIVYRPQLPLIELSPLPAIIRAAADGTPAEINLAGKLLPARVGPSAMFAERLEMQIIHNGKAFEPVEVAPAAQELPPSKVRLAPGDNQIQVLLNHVAPWRGGPTSAELQMRYVLPPRIKTLVPKLAEATPFVDLTAAVHSRSKLLDSSVRVFMNGNAQRFAAVEIRNNGADLWTVQVKEVPLVVADNPKVVKNQVKLLVSNEDAESDPIEAATPEYTKPPPPAPRIELIAPSAAPDLILEEPEIALTFRVHSAAPLKRVEVIVNQQLHAAKKITAIAPGLHEVETAQLPLQWGANSLQLVAVNEGGARNAAMTISVPPRPVRLTLASLRTTGPDPVILHPKALPDGRLQFPEVAEAKVLVEGHVRWSSRDDEALQKAQVVRVFVNGFQQVPAKLDAPAPDQPRERRFKAWVVLNLKENTIEAELPGLQQQQNSRTVGKAVCLDPKGQQHLHVLLVAPEWKKGADLNRRIVKALQARHVEANLYRTEVFDRVHLYQKTGDDGAFLYVFSTLRHIQGLLKRRADTGSPNDVVMVFFLGQQTIDVSDFEKNYFANYTGAQVLFLDLSLGADAASILTTSLRLALFRHIQPQNTPPMLLFQNLEKGLPNSTWLDELRPFLSARLQASQLLTQFPAGLKIQLNPHEKTAP